MNKKIIIIFIVTLLFILNGVSLIALAEQVSEKKVCTYIESDEIKEEIESLIDYYFNWSYSNLKMGNNDFSRLEKIINNDYLSEFKKAKFEWTSRWYKSIDEQIEEYRIYTDIKEIQFDKDRIYVEVIYGEDLINKRSPEIVQKLRNQNHILVICNSENGLVILNDYYEDNLAGEFFSIENSSNISLKKEKNNNKKLQETTDKIKKDIDNINNDSETYKNSLRLAIDMGKLQVPEKKANFTYNRVAVVNYAASYALKYNPNYTKYDADCTNFVSQCINAGGVPIDNKWFKDSNAWIRVTELRYWLYMQQYTRESEVQSTAREGDIVQLFNGSAWYHSLIITYKRTDGQLFVSSHSGDYYNRALANYTTNRRYLIFTN